MLLKLKEKLTKLGHTIDKIVIYSPLVVLKQVPARENSKTAVVPSSKICWALKMIKSKNPLIDFLSILQLQFKKLMGEICH